MPSSYLDFEQPLAQVDKRLDELRRLSVRSEEEQTELTQLAEQSQQLEQKVYGSLLPWQRVQLSRHIDRPYTLDYIERLCSEFIELHGDRNFSDDPAIVGGLARFRGQPVVVIGHQRGRTTAEKVKRNFGMPRPEGYRKALRLFQLAERFRRPVFTFIDTHMIKMGCDDDIFIFENRIRAFDQAYGI